MTAECGHFTLHPRLGQTPAPIAVLEDTVRTAAAPDAQSGRRTAARRRDCSAHRTFPTCQSVVERHVIVARVFRGHERLIERNLRPMAATFLVVSSASDPRAWPDFTVPNEGASGPQPHPSFVGHSARTVVSLSNAQESRNTRFTPRPKGSSSAPILSNDSRS
jgi:hypothetical protein